MYQDLQGNARAIRGRVDTTTEPGYVVVHRRDGTKRFPVERVLSINSASEPAGSRGATT